jgi:hypothetical protein
MQAGAEGDTEDVNRERAEMHLRLLAEEELRRATTRPSDGTSGSQPEDEAVRSAGVTGTLAGSAAVPDAFMASRRGRSAGRPAWRRPGEPVQRMGRRARRGRGHRGQRDRLARHPGHDHGDPPPARARDHPGASPSPRPTSRSAARYATSPWSPAGPCRHRRCAGGSPGYEPAWCPGGFRGLAGAGMLAAVPDAGPKGTAPPGRARPVCPHADLSLAPVRR